MATNKNVSHLYCLCCDYISRDSYNFNKHINTSKHQIASVRQPKSLQNCLDVANEIVQDSCCDVNESENNLIKISKIVSLQIPTNVGIEQQSHYTCDKCNKCYKHRGSLFKHRKKCVLISSSSNNIPTPTLESIKNTTEFQSFMIEHTKELQHFLLEQNKTIIELSNKINVTQNNSNNTNINSNNKFNLNVFLNETCKDAMNITDFMNTLQYKLSDLENTCDLGYAEGISRIMIRGLKDMDICKRPIHCSDLKRETIYLKVTNGWEKENETKDRLRKMIGTIANKNINQTCKWIEMHPNCKDWNNKNNTRYIKIVGASMGGADKEEDEKFMNKIIHNVSKEVVLKKTV